jgi:hypothetical protein
MPLFDDALIALMLNPSAGRALIKNQLISHGILLALQLAGWTLIRNPARNSERKSVQLFCYCIDSSYIRRSPWGRHPTPQQGRERVLEIRIIR